MSTHVKSDPNSVACLAHSPPRSLSSEGNCRFVFRKKKKAIPIYQTSKLEWNLTSLSWHSTPLFVTDTFISMDPLIRKLRRHLLRWLHRSRSGMYYQFPFHNYYSQFDPFSLLFNCNSISLIAFSITSLAHCKFLTACLVFYLILFYLKNLLFLFHFVIKSISMVEIRWMYWIVKVRYFL